MSVADVDDQTALKLAKLESFIAQLYIKTTGRQPEKEQESMHLLRKVFDFLNDIICEMPGYVYWVDSNNVYLGCNENHRKNIGLLSTLEIKGKTNYDMPWKKTAKLIDDFNLKVMHSRKMHVGEEFGVTFEHPEGAWHLSEKKPLFDHESGEIIGIVGTSLDITENKALEFSLKQAKQQEEELRNAVTMFAGSIAHDLRTPLATQSMQMRVLENKIEKIIEACRASDAQPLAIVAQLEKLLAFPQDIKSVTKDMNLYINDSLKALEKTVLGVKTAEDLVPCSLWKCLQKAIKSYPCSEEDRQKIHWDRSLDFDFMGNPISFYRVISNLLKNAFEQIQQYAQGEIYIRAEKTEQFNQLIIKDTAGHVTQEIIQQLFKSYKTTKKEGTGIGLVFCKSVMESFGGDITCQLVDGDKIEFCLSFPK